MAQTSQPYSGTVFHYGDIIPGYVEYTYTPRVWYDKSKSVNGGTWDIFNELGIAESLILGKTEDDLWTFEEILDEITKYFNLHIIQIGYDYYIFDWETAKTGNSIEWVNLLNTSQTKNATYQTIVVTKPKYADDSTQISMGDCYNQIMLTDKVEKFEDVILSPFDDDNLTPVMNHQKYMTELAATGQGNRAENAFKDLVNGLGVSPAYNDDDKSSTREWWFNVKNSKYWKFMLNGTDNYTQIPEDGGGNKYKQWMLAKYVDSTPWASGIFSFGKGDKVYATNVQDIQNITSFTDYICINVAGNGYDENSPTSETIYDTTTGMPIGTQPTHIYPSDEDIETSGMKIEYVNANDGVYSSADSSIMNYLVFTGKILMTTAAERTGSQGFAGYENDAYNIWTRETNNGNREYHYVDNTVFKRKNNTFQNVKNMITNNLDISGRCVGSDDNDDGRYYTDIFYNHNYPTDTPTPIYSENFLLPPCQEGMISKRFKYELNGNHSYSGGQAGWDSIPYVDVLACTLRIGDKYCVETISNGHKQFTWMTEAQLQAANKYLILDNGDVIYDAFIYLAVDINDGQYLIGEAHDIYNNITTDMNLDKKGMSVPLPSNAHLSGDLSFTIVGIVNNVWDEGIRRHPTWFRHTTWTNNSISIMPHVDKIWIEKFDVDLVSDKGKNVDQDNDIVYMSDETNKYVNRKDDLEFKFNTALTAAEANAMNVNPVMGKSTVVNISTGDAVLSIVNNKTSETDKPEKFYVDAYYREFCEPRIVLNTALKDDNSIIQFNKYTFDYLTDKTFFVIKTEKDVKNESINITMKQRNQ